MAAYTNSDQPLACTVTDGAGVAVVGATVTYTLTDPAVPANTRTGTLADVGAGLYNVTVPYGFFQFAGTYKSVITATYSGTQQQITSQHQVYG